MCGPERTRAVGAALILDGTQTVGAVPIDVKALDPDALIVAAYKWLLGPYSLSLAWFGECYLDGVPLEEAWIGRRGSENFAGLVDYVDDQRVQHRRRRGGAGGGGLGGGAGLLARNALDTWHVWV